MIKPPGNTLDLGCGPGFLCSLLADRGFSPYGVDISDEMLSLAKRRNPEADFAYGDEDHVPFAEHEFALVTAFSLLDYIENRRSYLENIVSRLKPGGFLVLSTSNNSSLFVVLAIISRILRWPLHRDQEWRDSIINLARTGIWSAGMVNIEKAESICGADALDRFVLSCGLARVTFTGMFNFSFLDRISFLNFLQDYSVGRWLFRRLAWDYIGFYRKP